MLVYYVNRLLFGLFHGNSGVKRRKAVQRLMEISEIKTSLKTPLCKAGKRSPSYPIRLQNIDFVKEQVNRTGLEFGKKERQLLIHTTRKNEKIYIQYPGKESTGSRPWDFRPIFYDSSGNINKNNQSFGDIWATIENNELLRIIATLLYRTAYMIDHTEIPKFKTLSRDITYDEVEVISAEKNIQRTNFYKYQPKIEIIDEISEVCDDWGKMSFEGFLHYNEILTWNEDCKYHYRDLQKENTGKWLNKTGRVNTLLTHIRILGYILEDVRLADIFNDFSKLRGISPATDVEIFKICHGMITS